MSSNRTSRKSARSICDHNDSLPPTKKFNAMHINENAKQNGQSIINHEQNGQSISKHEKSGNEKKKRKANFHPNSDPSVLNLPKFEYIWRTKLDSDDNSKQEMTGCKCTSTECDKRICKCGVGNVCLDANLCVKHPIRLSRHFYDSNYAECTSKCQCKGKCDLRFRTRSSIFQLVVKKCSQPKKGLGVFTENIIPAGSFVCELAGKFLTRKQWLSGGCNEYVFRFALRNEWTNSMADAKSLYTGIDARHCGNESRYINSSCKPNLCLLQSRNHFADHAPVRILLIAIRTIAVGEELTYFYGRKWLGYMRDQNSKFVCQCNQSNCRLPKVETKVKRYSEYRNNRLYPAYEFSDDDDHAEATLSDNELNIDDSDIEIIE